jgi:hypothetical protein
MKLNYLFENIKIRIKFKELRQMKRGRKSKYKKETLLHWILVCLCTINTDNSAKTKTGNVHITQH